MRSKLTILLLLLGLVMVAWSPSTAQNGASGSDAEGLYAPPNIANMERWKPPVESDRPADAYLQAVAEKSAAKPRREIAFAQRAPRVTPPDPATLAARSGAASGEQADTWPLGLTATVALLGLAGLLGVAFVAVLMLRRRATSRRAAPPAAFILGMPQARPTGNRAAFRQDEKTQVRRRAA